MPFIPQSGDIAIDVGAAEGTWTMDLSERFKTVIAIEPHPESYRILAEKAAGGHPASCIITNHAAISSHTGVKAIHLFEKPDHTSFFKEGMDNWRSEDRQQMFMARTYSLDELFSHGEWGTHDLHFVKVDTEGAENLVLTGAQHIVKELRPVWLIEYHSADNLWFCQNMLDVAGYKTQDIPHPNPEVQGHGWLSARP